MSHFCSSDAFRDFDYSAQGSHYEVGVDLEATRQWWIESWASQWCQRLIGRLCGT